MAAYTIIITKPAAKRIGALDSKAQARIRALIRTLAVNPRRFGYRKLKNSNPPRYRVRDGNYRVLYTIEDQIVTVTVLDVGHRKDIYD